jgi:prolyl oligopeptidase
VSNGLKLTSPDDAVVSTFEDQLLLRLRTDWNVDGKVFTAGSLLCGDFESCLKGSAAL